MSSTAAEILTQTSQEAPLPGATSTTAPVAAPAGWWDTTVKDPDLKVFLANKNYADPEIALKSYRSLESLVGAEKAGRTVMLPKDDKDEAGRKEFYAKIGVPETPEGYKLPLPDGDEGKFAKTASAWFHEAGVPAKSAELIATKWNDFITEQVKEGKAQEATKAEADLASLRVEWGHEFDTKSEMGRRGLREVGTKAGLDDKDLASLESSLGTMKMLKLFSQIGAVTAESSFAGGGGGGGFSMTTAAANEKLNGYITDRAAGKINDHQWRTEIEPEIAKLTEILTKAK